MAIWGPAATVVHMKWSLTRATPEGTLITAGYEMHLVCRWECWTSMDHGVLWSTPCKEDEQDISDVLRRSRHVTLHEWWEYLTMYQVGKEKIIEKSWFTSVVAALWITIKLQDVGDDMFFSSSSKIQELNRSRLLGYMWHREPHFIHRRFDHESEQVHLAPVQIIGQNGLSQRSRHSSISQYEIWSLQLFQYVSKIIGIRICQTTFTTNNWFSTDISFFSVVFQNKDFVHCLLLYEG